SPVPSRPDCTNGTNQGWGLACGRQKPVEQPGILGRIVVIAPVDPLPALAHEAFQPDPGCTCRAEVLRHRDVLEGGMRDVAHRRPRGGVGAVVEDEDARRWATLRE